jgi:hypothetical protein
MEGRRKLHFETRNNALLAKYCYSDQVSEGEMGKACSTHHEIRNTYKIQFIKHDGKRPLGRSRRRWENNIKIDNGKSGLGCGLDSSGSRQGPVACCCEHGNELSCSIKCGKCLDQVILRLGFQDGLRCVLGGWSLTAWTQNVPTWHCLIA